MKDYAYAIDELTQLHIGSGCTYDELIADENISFKFRTICKRYILQEVSGDTTLESHMYYLQPGSESCGIYSRLKTKVTVSEPEQGKTSRSGAPLYREKIYNAEELADIPPAAKQKRGMFIREITISKRALTGMVI